MARVYAEENAWAICPAMKWPLWLHMIPDMGYTPGLGWRDILPSTAVVALLESGHLPDTVVGH